MDYNSKTLIFKYSFFQSLLYLSSSLEIVYHPDKIHESIFYNMTPFHGDYPLYVNERKHTIKINIHGHFVIFFYLELQNGFGCLQKLDALIS